MRHGSNFVIGILLRMPHFNVAFRWNIHINAARPQPLHYQSGFYLPGRSPIPAIVDVLLFFSSHLDLPRTGIHIKVTYVEGASLVSEQQQ